MNQAIIDDYYSVSSKLHTPAHQNKVIYNGCVQTQMHDQQEKSSEHLYY